ncbi:cell division protein FtsA [Sporosarcina sp. CAU 1771]
MKILSTSLFALDIGTRSVVGIILNENEGSYHVADLISIEHKERSMIDGQIHNIISVANVIQEIKKTLEVKHGPLKRVSVAAAGRALKTVNGSMSIDITESSLISTEDVNRLELAAVQHAQQNLFPQNPATTEEYYYCVGYSVLHHKLDGEVIGSLIDQTGRSASVDVIATFLPQVVVESLLAALKRADLEMEALTLEPIAAINVLIPQSMRRLNVALVDIGAGTSDIAITNNSTVVAYGMVPLAGDEITDALSSHYLLDFQSAELTKRQLTTESEVLISDILGFEQKVSSEEVITIIKPSINRLAQSISQEIIQLNNGKSPQAVMVVGGGSLTPDITIEISNFLNLPANRVGIRGLEALSGVTMNQNISSSPELVTPIGIAIAARRAPIHYMSVSVNDKSIRLFELKEMTVSDALLATRIKSSQLYGKPGLGMTITVNGKDMIIPGEHGTPSTITLNGKIASTKDGIVNGDSIKIIQGKDGKNAQATPNDLFEELKPIHVIIDNIAVSLKPKVVINGAQMSMESSIADRDCILVSHPLTLSTALKKTNLAHLLSAETFTVSIDGKSVILKNQAPIFHINGLPIAPSYVLKNGDAVKLTRPSLPTATAVAIEAGKNPIDKITVSFNGNDVPIKKARIQFEINGQLVDGDTKVNKNDRIEMKSISTGPITFSDLFAFIDYSLPKNQIGSYQLIRNGTPIGFNDPIYGGDKLEITFTE